GRRCPSPPGEVIPRMLGVMRLDGWSYEQTEYFVNDSLVLRQFGRAYLEKVPDDTTLIRWANAIGPETLRALNDRVVQLARSLKVTRGRRLRVDTTAVETDIRFPTGSGLLGDGVRVVSRLLRPAMAALGAAAPRVGEAFRSWVRALPAAAPDRAPQGRPGPRRDGGGLWPADRGGQANGGQGEAGARRARATGRRTAGSRLAAWLGEFLPRLKR